MKREGNLEAPTRHPLDWKNPEFYDQAKLDVELERVFDICHGCRRCVSLCGSFPSLFDLVDATEDGEVHGIDKKDYAAVVDQCYLCDLCYMTKCPYVPPHEWNLDFPHLMLRAKAVKHENKGTSFRDNLLSSTDKLGSFAGIPIVTQAVNAINKIPAVRTVMESTLGVDKNAWIPEYAPKKFKQLATKSSAWPVKNGTKTPGKVVIYATCFINYNEPGIGQDLIKLLDHNEIPYELVNKEACCGMPKLELGDLNEVEKLKDINIPQLSKFAKEGYAILTPIPSCTLMFKQELPLMFPDEVDVQLVKEAMWDPFEYLIARKKDGLLKEDFKEELGHVSYHVPCHSRVQNVGKKTAETLEMIPGTTVNVVERCSGHSGTWGVKKEFHAMAMKIGKPVFKNMANNEPDYISSDCQLAGHHIEQGMAEAGLKQAKMMHPISLVVKAYGLAE
ncbi:MAG: heterodisulfide reductase-related iron-sulfur binding cluster [Betaproteobacteria bacterium]